MIKKVKPRRLPGQFNIPPVKSVDPSNPEAPNLMPEYKTQPRDQNARPKRRKGI